MTSTKKAKKKKTARKTRKTAASVKQSKRRKIAVSKPRSAAKKKRSAKRASKEIRSPEPSTLGGRTFPVEARTTGSRRSSASAGPSGDAQGLSRKAVVDSESVEELVDEGQAREAAAI